jgi:hypothetical protein
MTTKTTRSLLAAAGVAWGALACAGEAPLLKEHPDSKAWENLFAADLSNAVNTKNVWSVQDGVLTATQDEALWTTKEYENFVLDLEFKNAPATNSGVILYCSDVGNWIPNSLEIQILDDTAEKWGKVDKTWLCAGIFGHLAPAKQVVKKAGEWNRMTIAAKGPRVCVMLNGEVTVDADLKQWTSAKKNPDGSAIPEWLSKPMAELTMKGRIGFQGKHGDAPIYFRNIRIRAIK